jgi:hypothetical protein
MDATIPTTDPAALLRQLDPDTIRERIDALDRERAALMVLLRAAMRAHPDRATRHPEALCPPR